MLKKWDKSAIETALPGLREMKAQLGMMHNRPYVTGDYKRLINTLYCQVFSVITQFDAKIAENACNEATQAPLFETVEPDAAGVRPVLRYRDRLVLATYCPEFWAGK